MSTERATCTACDTPRRPDDRFCKQCGAGLLPPPTCPSCAADVPKDAKFCPACGIRVIGPRPDGPAAPAPSAPATSPATPAAARAIVDDLRKKAPSRVSGIVANVLLFAGVLLVFVVFTRQWNEGKAKEGSMFGGGAPAELPAAKLASPPPADVAKERPAGGDHVSGTVTLAPGLASEGVLFVLLRPAGSPERGPPLAVRLFDGKFPVEFTLGAEHVMIQGQPFTGPFDLYARLDRDGNAMTREASDVAVGPISGLVPGGAPITVALGGPAGAAAPAPVAPVAPVAGAGSGPIEGKIALDPAVGPAAGAALYVIVRPAGSPDRGPPVAVRKYDHPSFPLSFSVGPDDMMMEGSTFSGPFDVWARLDGDGDAASRQPGDVETSKPAAQISAGARSIDLVLDRRR